MLLPKVKHIEKLLHRAMERSETTCHFPPSTQPFTEINAGLVIVMRSGHPQPLEVSDLEDVNRDPDAPAVMAH